ncbi:class D beta-lactamase OXA-576 [Campylobacter jejuni]|uniref:beta-lactamase n=1 Tax=Campylobacter jejuni TaxID=197 RepID=A0A2S1CWV6_CAMJU|nr:class D beta-lactamase OXA-576 [Campylobacter jejuni]AWD39715.1 class D beta-lactamase OXA-576 [Campylobacter jejuni]EAH6087409.1 class D beta-lactamase OXA-576 [Campylobacter jejuni]EAH6088155.1 class D beta-lactamase OXA-576 [Campylobacter jejuni]EAH7700411.1 class D beta-lactamase OXA-576 [Campylobacter jejuni]EAH7700882.1 class D beta-lactamase OXA-576 [Campylobacter jejuni]
MKKITLFLLFLNLVFGQDKILNNWFKEYNTSGTFVFYDGKTWASNDFSRAMETFSPASTFKIFNALIALDSGVIKTKKEIFYHYRGEKVFLSSWAQDMNLSSAIKYSNVLAFKEVARRIGIKTMQEYLNKLHYGNAKISKIDTFWLDNSLKISAKEQAILLFKLSQNSLPFSKKSQEEVKKIILFKEDKIQKIYAKTGFNDGINLAWIVGFIESKNKILSFALNVDIKNIKNLKIREELLEKYIYSLN